MLCKLFSQKYNFFSANKAPTDQESSCLSPGLVDWATHANYILVIYKSKLIYRLDNLVKHVCSLYKIECTGWIGCPHLQCCILETYGTLFFSIEQHSFEKRSTTMNVKYSAPEDLMESRGTARELMTTGYHWEASEYRLTKLFTSYCQDDSPGTVRFI